ncbi:MAG: hypothetical protein R2825_00705 [Saprospiraceae bacterium]
MWSSKNLFFCQHPEVLLQRFQKGGHGFAGNRGRLLEGGAEQGHDKSLSDCSARMNECFFCVALFI